MTEATKATRAIVRLGDREIEGFMLPDGGYRMSQTQAAELVGLRKQNASDFLRSKALKSLLGEGYTGQKNLVEIESTDQVRGGSRIDALPLEVVSAYWLWQAHRGNKQALSLCMSLVTETLDRRFDAAFGVQRSEAEYNQRLSQRVRLLENSLDSLSEAYAADDDARAELERLRRFLRDRGFDPYSLPGDG